MGLIMRTETEIKLELQKLWAIYRGGMTSMLENSRLLSDIEMLEWVLGEERIMTSTGYIPEEQTK